MELNNNKPIAVIGNCHTGKTTLCLFLAFKSEYAKRYLLGYPSKVTGFNNLNDVRDLTRISDCVLVIDEIDEILPFYDKKSNEALKRLLKFTAHNNIKVIFNTQLSQFISKMMAALVPCFAITEIDIFELKNGSKPKKILLNYLKLPEIINREAGMKLPRGKFIWYDDYAQAGENGIYDFPDLNIPKAWRNATHKEKKRLKEEIKRTENPE